MVMIKEFRIPMPFTLDEYKLGQRYSVARASNESTTSSEGIELLENKPYDHIEANDPEKKVIQGTYTKKIYHLKSMIPGWLSAIVPNSALKLYEEAWDVYPYCKTVLTFPFLGDRFIFTIESRHTAGELGVVENIHNLDKEKLNKRKVEHIDITKEQVEKKYYKKEEDPTIFVSKSGKGPLTPNWQKETPTSNIMCCYKLVTVRCKITGTQDRIEKFMLSMERQIFLKFHQQIYCWTDEWFGKTLAEIIEIESKMFSDMNKKIDPNATAQEEKNLEKAISQLNIESSNSNNSEVLSDSEEKEKEKEKSHPLELDDD